MSEPYESDELNHLARVIIHRGLNGPVVLLLAAARPFRYLLNQLMVVAAPLVGWSNAVGTSHYSWLLEDGDHFDQLIAMLEEPTGGLSGEERL